MTPAEFIAVGEYLSDFPADCTFDQICEMIEMDSEAVTVWEPFELYASDWIVGHMTNLKECIENAFNPDPQVA